MIDGACDACPNSSRVADHTDDFGGGPLAAIDHETLPHCPLTREELLSHPAADDDHR